MTSREGHAQSLPKKKKAKAALVMCLFLFTLSGANVAETGVNVLFAQEASEVPTSAVPLTTDQVVRNMVERNEQRARTLESYRGIRTYHLEYHGLSGKSATLVVSVTYRRPDEKRFCILSKSGSEFLQGRVLKRLLEAETEAMREDHRRLTAMGPENYEFRLVAVERIADQNFYVLEATPRIKNKFLFRGRIWVEGRDFAVARMEGEPAKNPSWWTKRNDIHLTYEKVGEFWLPARNETNTQVRFLGRSVLTIVYQDYEILSASAEPITATSGGLSGCPQEATKLSEVRP